MSNPFHSLDIASTVEKLKVNPSLGLEDHEAESRLAAIGKNLLPKSKHDGPLRIFFRQFQNPLIYVLLFSAIVTLYLKKLTDALVVLGVVILNSLIGFIQEFRAGKAIQALSSMLPNRCSVLRNGSVNEIDAALLVPGDIVFLRSGDKVPSDMRILESKNLRIDESALTGESVPTEKSPHTVKKEASIGDQTSMAFNGTLVTYGTAKGVVTVTGSKTQLGQISTLIDSATSLETPLTKALEKVGKYLTIGIAAVALLLLGIGLWRDFPLVDAVLAAISLAVAAIPEGLPAIVTITLAIGVRRLANRRAVIRKLPAVETLGSTSVICTDKTGTLTKNEMTVQALWTPEGYYRMTGTGYENNGQLIKDGVVLAELPEDVYPLLKAGVLCNDSEIKYDGSKRSYLGDPTEIALLVAFEKAGGIVKELKRDYPRQDVVPFESELQYMATYNVSPEKAQKFIFLKGAPEVVIERCKSDQLKDEALRAMTEFAGDGMRVLAFARKILSNSTSSDSDTDLKDGFELLGLQAMIDPPRPEVIEAIQACHSAGITVKMITGDHRETAYAIGKQIGIVAKSRAATGELIAKSTDEELIALTKEVNVFARVAPEHKLKLVKAIQNQNQIVAMTGDGVNDAPALKQANIGVAMGITGTSVSKEAADLVLTDDNFSTIKEAIEEGRRIYDNLVKALAFVLPTNLGEALIILIAVMLFPVVGGQPLMPILPVQILWINLVATVALALPLAFEAKEPNLMKRMPRNPDEPILSRFLLIRTVVVAVLMAIGAIGLFLYEYQQGLAQNLGTEKSLRIAQTMAVTTVIFFQIFYLLNCRSLRDSILKIGLFSNPSIYLGILTLVVLQIGFVHLPIMNTLFSSSPLSSMEWLKSMLAGTLILPVIGLEKMIENIRSKSEIGGQQSHHMTDYSSTVR